MGTKNSTSLLVHYKTCLACEGTGDSKPDWLVDRPSRNNCERCRGFGYTLQGNRAKFRQALTDLAKNVCPHCDAALAEVERLRGELADAVLTAQAALNAGGDTELAFAPLYQQALEDIAALADNTRQDAPLTSLETAMRAELADCQRQANNLVASLEEACDEVERLRAALRLPAQEAMNR